MGGTESLFSEGFFHLSLRAGLREEGFQGKGYLGPWKDAVNIGDLQTEGCRKRPAFPCPLLPHFQPLNPVPAHVPCLGFEVGSETGMPVLDQEDCWPAS